MTRQGPGGAEGPASAAWRWSVEHSPLARAWRGLGRAVRRQRGASELLAASGLPAEARGRIDAIVRRTHLWHDERAEIARELIAHAEDALGHGRSGAEVVEELGEVRTIAPLLRRSAKRKRSVLARARAYAARSIGVLALVLVVGYAALAVRFFTGEPTVRTNYIALLNERHAGLGEDDKAWPVYQQVIGAWRPAEESLSERSAFHERDTETWRFGMGPGVDHLPGLAHDHPDFPMVADAVRALRPELDRAAAAASRPTIGYLYAEHFGDSGAPAAPGDHPPANEGGLVDWPLFDLMLPHLRDVRTLARLLAFDARLAASEGDAARTAEVLAAMFGLSRQMGREPFLISNLVAIGLHALAIDTVLGVIEQESDVLTAAHLDRLARVLEGTRNKAIMLDLTSQAYFFDDFMQRAFTDDGRGGGRLTPAGLRLLSGLTKGGMSTKNGRALKDSAVGPIGMAAMADRRRQTEFYRSMLAAAERTLCDGPHTIGVLAADIHDRLEAMGPVEQARYLPTHTLAPALHRAAAMVFRVRAQNDAARVILAIERYRLEHGRPPPDLRTLENAYLASLPEDPFQPGTPIKYRPAPDTPLGFVLYYAGSNGADNDGHRPKGRHAQDVNRFTARYHYPPEPGSTDRHWRPSSDAPDGDWVIFPSEPDP